MLGAMVPNLHPKAGLSVAPQPTPASSSDTRPLRVAIVSEYYYPDLGGMPEHVHHLARSLSARGHSVVVVTTRFDGHVEPMPGTSTYEVVRIGRACPPLITNGSVSRAAIGWRLGAQIQRLFTERNFDVIHVHAPLFPTLALLAIRYAPPTAKLIGTLHTHLTDSTLLRWFRRPLQRYLNALDAIVAVSPSAIDCLRRLGFELEAAVIGNGIDLDYWQSGRPLTQFLDGRPNLLVQARLEPRNHIGTILAALRQLQQGAFPDGQLPRLLVLGEGPLRTSLQAQSHGLPVHFAGSVLGGRADFAATSAAFCFSAAIASHPMSLMEGMAAGRPVLCHQIAGVPELVTDGVEGFVLPLNDAASYAAALSHLLRDDELRCRMGAAARRRVAEFAWPKITHQLEDLYYRTKALSSGGLSSRF